MWNQEVLEQMLDRGFVLENGELKYARGSIANYTKVRVCAPYNQTSLAEGEKDIPACYIEYEDFSEPGYLEIDHHTIKKFSVAEKNLVAWAEEKHLGESTAEREERKKYWEELRRRRNVRIQQKDVSVSL